MQLILAGLGRTELEAITRSTTTIAPRPTTSWLRLVELWFAKIERDGIARSICTTDGAGS